MRARPTASWPDFAGTRAARMPSARCCSASTTITACCITSASPRRSRWRCASSSPTSSRRCGRTRSTIILARVGASRATRRTRMPGGQSRWSAGKDLSWEPLRIERVCEVKYDHLQGDRFRHAAIFLRWRPDKPPATAATISSRSRPLTSSRRFSARASAA